jgi:hypothetical protein
MMAVWRADLEVSTVNGKWIWILSFIAVISCTSGPTPISVSGYGITATVVIPQQQPRVVPVTTMPTLVTPTLFVPPGTAVSQTATVLPPKGAAAVIPVLEAPIKQPTLGVPK